MLTKWIKTAALCIVYTIRVHVMQLNLATANANIMKQGK